MDATAEELLESCKVPNNSWRKLLYKATSLQCGGMILCTMFNHCLCDDTSSSQFLHAWAKLIREPNTELTMVHFSHLGYTRTNPAFQDELLLKMMMMMQSQSESLVVTLFTFGASDVVWLKQQCVPEIIVKLPKGYYGNGFVLACAEIIVKDLVAVNLRHGLEVVNEAKASLDDEEYIRSI
ncbi:hypothetical protein JHK87_048488 [Glycine soja]|nr:hypothetical protein JHK87_048488 [Glycine soja]